MASFDVQVRKSNVYLQLTGDARGILVSHKFGNLKVKLVANCDKNFRDDIV